MKGNGNKLPRGILLKSAETRANSPDQLDIKFCVFFWSSSALCCSMVFYLIGLGLGDAGDITVNGLNIVRSCAKVFLESYTSMLSNGPDLASLEQFYGRSLLEADRELVEQRVEQLLEEARTADIALLVVGDPFGATTHADLVLRARELDVPLRVIHNASILTAVGCCGLQLYNFGVTVSIPMWIDGWEPDSFLDKILLNRQNGMHTLCLLDIKVKEQSTENLMKGNRIFEPSQFLTCPMAAQQLLSAIQRRRTARANDRHDDSVEFVDERTPVVGMARVGWADQKIVHCPLNRMASADLGPPLHVLIVPAVDEQLHPMEREMLQTFSI
uniref:diphthine methyl ester synthase n=1 Tax=Globodera rostochiensis TaxID=31243 RepID=A0A914GV29_GLORO